MASHFQEAMQEKKETKSSQACFLQAQYDIKGNERMSDFSLPKYNVILDDYIAL